MEETMSGIEVNNESAEDDKLNVSKTNKGGGIECKEYCLKNPWTASKEKMTKVKHLEVKRAKNERTEC